VISLRKLIALTVFAVVSVVGAGTAFAAEHHPSKFGPHDQQCAGTSNQPNCPGSH
jgi:hypothetical protein